MKTRILLYATLLAAAAVLLLAGGAVAQSEMTSKIRLECAAGSAECPAAASQFDFSVSNSDFGIRKVGAAADNLHIVASNGRVGVGTNSPLATFHIFGSSGADIFNGIGPDPTSAGTAMNYGYAGASFGLGAGFFNVRPAAGAAAPNPSLRFMTANFVRMTIDNDGNIGIGINSFPGNFDPTHPFEHAGNGAHLTAGGAWTNGSSRALKDDIVALSADEAMSALESLEPVRFKYKAEPTESYVGFIAEDVPELVASVDHKTVSSMDVVAVLARVVKEHEKTIAQLQKELDDLKSRKRR